MLSKPTALLSAFISLSVCLYAGVGTAVAGAAQTRVAFLGDSYTFGTGATVPTRGYAYDVARDEHWNATVEGLPGSGYVRIAAHDGENIAAGLTRVIAAQPRIVIVECGHNDAIPGVAYQGTETAALADLRTIRNALPTATIVVIGPVWLDQYPTNQALAVRNYVHAAQEQISNSVWIDPIAQRWFTGSWANRTADDATMINYQAGHPNDLGYQHMASLLEADLTQLRVTS